MKKIFAGLVFTLAIMSSLVSVAPAVLAVDCNADGIDDGEKCLTSPSVIDPNAKAEACKGITGGQTTDCGDPGFFSNFVTNIITLLTFIIGGIAVLMLIVGGVRYVVSGGDSNAVQGAKNTILYAIIGIIVAASAYLIVRFVIGSV